MLHFISVHVSFCRQGYGCCFFCVCVVVFLCVCACVCVFHVCVGVCE